MLESTPQRASPRAGYRLKVSWSRDRSIESFMVAFEELMDYMRVEDL
jgi:hypothetical protein